MLSSRIGILGDGKSGEQMIDPRCARFENTDRDAEAAPLIRHEERVAVAGGDLSKRARAETLKILALRRRDSRRNARRHRTDHMQLVR